jgi:phage head maturation protease
MPELHPTENLFRGLAGEPIELRAEGDAADTATTLFGHFARFDSWNEIDSWYEGRFLERVAKGAYKKSMREQRDTIKVQFDHGYDSFVGGGSLGPVDVLREEDFGPYYEVPLLDTDYNRDRVLPMLQGRTLDGRTFGSVLGASYRFRVTREDWVEPKKASDWNPEKLPERTIREVRLYEFGPVVFPADPGATSGARSLSLTDHYLERQAARTGGSARAAANLAQIAGVAAPLGTTSEPPTAPPDEAPGGMSHIQLRAMRARLARKAS